MPTCAMCGLGTQNTREFREHVMDAHGWVEPRAGDNASAGSWVMVVLVSFLATAFLLIVIAGVSEIGYKYLPAVLALIQVFLVLRVTAVIGFDVTMVVGDPTRWRWLIPAGVVWLICAGALLYVAVTTPY